MTLGDQRDLPDPRTPVRSQRARGTSVTSSGWRVAPWDSNARAGAAPSSAGRGWDLTEQVLAVSEACRA